MSAILQKKKKKKDKQDKAVMNNDQKLYEYCTRIYNIS